MIIKKGIYVGSGKSDFIKTDFKPVRTLILNNQDESISWKAWGKKGEYAEGLQWIGNGKKTRKIETIDGIISLDKFGFEFKGEGEYEFTAIKLKK